MKVRCQWAVRHPELISYHDKHWGTPQHDDRVIFGAYAQCILHAGLLWTALLKKREVFKRAFDDWEVAKIADYGPEEWERLMETAGMIRNQQKLRAIIHNAGRFLEIQRQFGSFDRYIWGFVAGEPIICDHLSNPATGTAQRLAADLKRRGFKFAGEATALGLMQDIGLINDHDPGCWLYPSPKTVDSQQP